MPKRTDISKILIIGSPIIIGLLFTLFGTISSAQGSSGGGKWTTLDRLCGRLEHVEYLPTKSSINSFPTKAVALKQISLRLYEFRPDAEGWKNASSVEEI